MPKQPTERDERHARYQLETLVHQQETDAIFNMLTDRQVLTLAKDWTDGEALSAAAERKGAKPRGI